MTKPNDALPFTEPLLPLLRLPYQCLVWQHGYAWSLHHLQSLLRTESDDAHRFGDSDRHVFRRHSEHLISTSADYYERSGCRGLTQPKEEALFPRGSSLFSITERQYGCVGEPQYLSGTSARPRHRLLLRHAFPGGELAAGKRSGAAPQPACALISRRFPPRTVRSKCRCQLYLFCSEVRVIPGRNGHRNAFYHPRLQFA